MTEHETFLQILKQGCFLIECFDVIFFIFVI